MIDDQEMRELFRIEAEEHLQGLEAGLMRLEREPADSAVLDDVFREIHSMKGAARMLGLREIETLSHAIEDLFGRVNRGEVMLTPSHIDVICHSLDGVAELVTEALTGEPAGVIAGDLLARLKDINPQPAMSPVSPGPEETTTDDVDVKAAVPTGTGETSSSTGFARPEPSRPDPGEIETIRVETRKLDKLLNQSGELAVTSLRLARHIADLESVLDMKERQRSHLGDLSRADIDEGGEELFRLLDELKTAFRADSSRLELMSTEITAGVRDLRMLPMATLFQRYQRMTRDLARQSGKECELTLSGSETAADKRILDELKDPLMHLLRNAIDHGIEPTEVRRSHGKQAQGRIELRAFQSAGQVVIEVEDDGCGLDLDRIRQAARKHRLWREEELERMPAEQLQQLVFTSGLSTSSFVSDMSGRGIGLDVVRANVERLKGTVSVASQSGVGTTFHIRLPAALVTSQVIMVRAGGLSYALPIEFVVKTLLLRRTELFTLEGHNAILVDDEPVAVARLVDLLPLARTDFCAAIQQQQTLAADDLLSCLLVKAGHERFALLVDELGEDQEVMIKTSGDFLDRIPGVSGTIILGDGEVCMVLNPADFLSAIGTRTDLSGNDLAQESSAEKKLILLAEDSLTTRTRMKRILEHGGYEVVTAVDGADALTRLGTRNFDGLVSDINMPNMDGLTLTSRLRQLRRYAELPVILVTMLASEDDKKRGLEAGANAYITKAAFDQKLLLDTLRRLI